MISPRKSRLKFCRVSSKMFPPSPCSFSVRLNFWRELIYRVLFLSTRAQWGGSLLWLTSQPFIPLWWFVYFLLENLILIKIFFCERRRLFNLVYFLENNSPSLSHFYCFVKVDCSERVIDFKISGILKFISCSRFISFRIPSTMLRNDQMLCI